MHAGNGEQHPIGGDPRDPSRELQRKLYRAAKKRRKRRFHALQDRIYRPDVLWRAWEQVKVNRGSAGIDGQTIEEVEKLGVPDFLQRLQTELREGKYRPQAVKRVYIPKPDGRKRPLGIPTIRDRVVQAACRIVIEPIFEADFLPCSYGFRPKRSAREAIKEVRKELISRWYVVDADIQGFFDNLDQDLMMRLVQRRISDRRVLKLIRGWLKAGVLEGVELTPTEVGTPQGGVISPLLANIYLHELDRQWTQRYEGLGKLIRYADDFVIICRYQEHAQSALKAAGRILEELRLTLNPDKTRIAWTDESGFDFLGFHIRKSKSHKSGKYVPYAWPSAKAMKRIRSKIRSETDLRWRRLEREEIVRYLNRVIRGWCGYFRIANATRKLQQLDRYVVRRLRRLFSRQGRRSRWTLRRVRAWRKQSGLEYFYIPGRCGRPL